MVFNTISVGAAVTPTVVETYFSHYLNRKPHRQKPTAHISYHEGVNLIRQFLNYASHHTVEDLQAFTAQWVPNPRWVKVDEVAIPQSEISRAAEALVSQLGPHGIDKIGGQKWWQWRREGSTLKAEWIEMRRDSMKRNLNEEKGKRVMLYVHGGAYFFGSVDEHRYQMQRHARKLEARVIARVLVILRDRGLPLPAGAILISPWVDLTHSFPSVAGDGSSDYIPAHGFLQRPSASWPPPNTDDMEQIAMHAVEQVAGEALPRKSSQAARHKAREEAVQGFSVDHTPRNLNPRENENNPFGTDGASERPGNTIPGVGHDLSIMLDGKLVKIKDQIQMYTTNQLISHPLVSPVLQPSLGGLPPLLILTGGGEVLRDEQIYLAHKAASPVKFPPGEAYLDEYPEARGLISKWKPTDVQLQVWDDLCHVAPTLSFTRPAKYMFRSIAQFGAWALARAQKTEIQIMEDDEMSVISSGSSTDSDEDIQKPTQTKATIKNGIAQGGTAADDKIGRAGEPLPPFKNHMIRQRVDRHGCIYPLDPPPSLPALQIPSNEIGVIKPGPVRKWLTAKKEWDSKYAREKRKVQKQRAKEMAGGYQGFGDDEVPPPSALAGRRGLSMPKVERRGKSWGMSLWALWGSSHDGNTIIREEKADKDIVTTTVSERDGANARPADGKRLRRHPRSRSRRRTVTHAGQANNEVDRKASAVELERREEKSLAHGNDGVTSGSEDLAPPVIVLEHSGTDENVATAVQSTNSIRPVAGGKAFPFKLGTHAIDDGRNASTVTLHSQAGVVTPKGNETSKQLGEEGSKKSEEIEPLAEQPSGAVKKNNTELGEQALQNGATKQTEDASPIHSEGRRGTLEDAKGVLHHGVNTASNSVG